MGTAKDARDVKKIIVEGRGMGTFTNFNEETCFAMTDNFFRCTAPGGSVTYQQVPCPTTDSGGAVDIPSSFPDANALERERLFEREAALDARLLKRAEIDAAERIAREDRLARERELQAQVERDRAQNIPVYVVGPPLRMQRHTPRRPWPIAIR